jgi:phage I-like protein
MATQRAFHSLPLDSGSGDGWYHLLQAGEFSGRDGRGPYLNDQPASILSAFAQWGMPLCIDYHHQSENAEAQTGLVPAAGWGKEMEVREGSIWCRIEWTATAAKAIAAKEVMYLSPVFDYDSKTGRVLQIVMAGLTNTPNLDLESLTSHSQGGPMDDIVERICYVLNLPLTSTPQEIMTHVQRVVDYLGGQGGAAATEEAMQQAANALGLAANAKWPDIARAAASRLTSGQLVPKAEFDRVSHELKTLRQSAADAAVETAVREAMQARKILPAQQEVMRTFASRDMAGFKAFIEAQPEIVPAGEVVPNGAPNASASHAAELPVPPGYSVDAEQAELHKRAKAYQAKHGGSFVKAVKAVQTK